jgi:DNA-binding NarL/FixJ family response regulator
MSAIRTVVADDHELVLEGLRSLLDAEDDIDVVATATTGHELLEHVRRQRPDVVLLDLDMPGLDGLACLRAMRDEDLRCRVLVLTAYSDGASMRAAIEGGADGYALKTEPPRQTVASIRQVHRGQLVFPLAAKRWLLGRSTPADPALTEREREILALVAEGGTNARIAGRLRVSENTVKFHLQNIFTKLGVTNRTEAAAVWLTELGRRG